MKREMLARRSREGARVGERLARFLPPSRGAVEDGSSPERISTADGRRRSVEDIVRDFTLLYYDNQDRTWTNTTFLGVNTWKCPLDLWLYQEIIWRVRPGLIVETGTAFGGSALFLASMCDLVGSGEVVTIDLQLPSEPPSHPRITYLTGSSTDIEIVETVTAKAVGAQPVIVILDSDHSREHVRQEIRCYAPLVTPGSYLIVEDTCIRHPVLPDWGEGPWEAVQDFLAEDDRFAVDRGCEKFWLTFNPGGYLRRS